MKILIDADASPVKNEVIQLAEEFQLEISSYRLKHFSLYLRHLSRFRQRAIRN